jgi:hypothetical protein
LRAPIEEDSPMSPLLSALALSIAALATVGAQIARGSAAPPSEWHYIVPAQGDDFEHAPFRALVLSRQKPDELVEKAHYRGVPAERRYTQIRFGSPSSTRVTLVVDTLANGDVDLYADTARTLSIDDRDRVTPRALKEGARRERIWQVPVAVAIVEQDAVKTIPRAVVLRLGASGQTLGYAAAGYFEGSVTLGGHDGASKVKQPARTLAARRVDGDGSGLLADPQDRIWIDLNGDGKFDATSEQFLYNSVLNLEGERYVVLSDQLGTRLAFEPLLGTATLRLAIAPKAGAGATEARGIDVRATAVGRDGSVFALTGTEPATVPAGDYRVSDVTISLDDPTGGERWSFVFSRGGVINPPRWYKAAKDALVTIDPIGAPRFEMELRDPAALTKRGDDVTLRPALYTGDGLLIVTAYRGNPVSPAMQEILSAVVKICDPTGQSLATAHSGFS